VKGSRVSRDKLPLLPLVIEFYTADRYGCRIEARESPHRTYALIDSMKETALKNLDVQWHEPRPRNTRSERSVGDESRRAAAAGTSYQGICLVFKDFFSH